MYLGTLIYIYNSTYNSLEYTRFKIFCLALYLVVAEIIFHVISHSRYSSWYSTG